MDQILFLWHHLSEKSIQPQEDFVIGNDSKIAGWQADMLEYYKASLPQWVRYKQHLVGFKRDFYPFNAGLTTSVWLIITRRARNFQHLSLTRILNMDLKLEVRFSSYQNVTALEDLLSLSFIFYLFKNNFKYFLCGRQSAARDTRVTRK